MKPHHSLPLWPILTLSVFLLLSSVSALAQGSPPFYTDDTATAEKGQWCLDLGVATERARCGDYTWNAPSIDLAYGLTNQIEFSYGVPMIIVQLEGESARSGLGNSVAGVKWRFYEDDAAKFAVSVNPQVEFDNPTSSRRRGLVENNTGFFLPFQMRKAFGEIETAFNVGRIFHVRNASESDVWQAGIAVGRQFAEPLHVGVELYGETSLKFERSLVILNLGAVYTVNDRFSLSASLGHGVGGADRPHFVGFVGVQLLR